MPVVDTGGPRVSYEDVGLGTPIIFVPGVAGSKEWFCYQASGLRDRYRVISYDLRLARGRCEYSLDLLADDLTRFVDALRLTSAVVAGHSLGGLIALRFAASRPQCCAALILCSTAPSFRKLSREELVADLVPKGVEFDGFFSRLWKRLFARESVQEDEANPLAYLARCNGDLDEVTLNARLEILRETDLTPLLEEVEAPTLILAGSEERSYVLAGSQLANERIYNSKLEVLEGADHYCFYTRHDLFNAALVDYLCREAPRP